MVALFFSGMGKQFKGTFFPQNDTVIHVLKTYCLHFYSDNWNADLSSWCEWERVEGEK